DPDTARLVGGGKWNHGIPQPSLSFAVESVDVPPSDLHDEVIEEVPLLRPLGTVPMDAATILRQAAELAEPDEEEKATARSQAWAALVAILKDGKEHRVRDLQEALPDHDWSTVKRAARDNGVESKPDPTHTGRGRAAVWYLPAGLLVLLRAQEEEDDCEGWGWPGEPSMMWSSAGA